MRTIYHTPHLRALSQASALVLIGFVSVGCSSDAVRFEKALVTNSIRTNNQHTILKTQAPVAQPYPDDVSSANDTEEVSDGIKIVRRKPVVVNAAPLAPAVSAASLPKVGKRPVPHKPMIPAVPKVAAATAPVSAPTVVTKSGPVVLAPRQKFKNPLRMANTDPASTGSVKPAVKAGTTTETAGWTKAGGTWVILGSGETVYNLSRRYGVPVTAIKRANNIKDINAVQAGSKVLIPTYNFAKSVPVSAPDNNPITKASRASTGYAGQVRGRVAVPTKRVNPVVSKARSIKPAPSQSTNYVVQSGDTLYGIARKLGVKPLALQQANGMSGTVVRLGQKLNVPSSTGQVVANSQKIDKTVTGSLPKKPTTIKTAKTVLKPAKASSSKTVADKSAEKVKTSAKSGAGSFRWPAQGRVIAKFGERVRGNTNDGIDISVPEGTAIKASENGTVIYSGSELEDFGKLVLVSHSGGWVTAYGHTSANLVKRGDRVRRGQVIARSGKTGNATVPKVHFELRRNSNPVNPLKYLK